MNEDPFYERRPNPTWPQVRAELHAEFPELEAEYYKQVRKPPWWRPFARRRWTAAWRVLTAHALNDLLTPPPS